MMQSPVPPLFGVAAVLLTATATAEDNWQPVPRPSPIAEMWAAVNNGEANWLSSAGLSWPDGRQSVVIHFRRGDNLWRCMENFTARMEYNEAMCYRLVEKERK